MLAYRSVTALVIATGVLAFLSALAWTSRLAFSVSVWVDRGEWPTYTVRQFMAELSVPVPHSGLLGIQKIINSLVDQSLTWAAFIATLLFYGLTLWLAMGAGARFEHQRRLQRLKEERRSARPEMSLQ
jgi:hypothetical protein